MRRFEKRPENRSALRLWRAPRLRFWHAWRERRRLVRLDAEMLMDKFGVAAYEVAWSMARDIRSGELIDMRTDGHWEQVLAFIAARTGKGAFGR
jgi:hypothetical protein